MARILVVCGGENLERRVSLASGDTVGWGLVKSGHDVLKLDTAEPGILHYADEPLLEGIVGPTPPEDLLKARMDGSKWAELINSIVSSKCDAVFPILHGSWGEDGRFQALMELIGIPYLGSGVLSSQICMNKIETKKIALLNHIPCARDLLINENMRDDEIISRILSDIELPCVIKPASSGSAVDVFIIHEANDLIPAVNTIRNHQDFPMVEEYIAGRELTVTILGDNALPVIEIVPSTEFYDYTRKYTKGQTRYICPAPIDHEISRNLQDMSLEIFRKTGCRHIARVDWRLSEQGKPYFLEINTIPGMTALSLVPMAAKEVGISFDQLMQHFVDMTLQ